MSVKQIATDVLYNAISLGVIQMTGVEEIIHSKAQSDATKAIAMGVNYSLAQDAVHYVLNKQSKVLDMNYKGFLDDVVYNSAWYVALVKSGVGEKVGQSVNGISPLDHELNARFISAGLVVGGGMLRDVIDNSPQLANTGLSYITHASQLIPY